MVLIAGGISFSVTLLHFSARDSSGALRRRVVGIYLNKCFNFILTAKKTHKIERTKPRLPICFHNLLQINCNNSWWMSASTNLQPLTFYDSRHYFICQSFIEMCYWNILHFLHAVVHWVD